MAKARRPSNDSMVPYVGENLSALRQYSLSVSGTSSYVSTRAVGVPYLTLDGTWRMRFNMRGTSSSATSITLTVTGVAFKNVIGGQALSVAGNGSSQGYFGSANSGAATILLAANVNQTDWTVSGDVELDSKPSFVP